MAKKTMSTPIHVCWTTYADAHKPFCTDKTNEKDGDAATVSIYGIGRRSDALRVAAVLLDSADVLPPNWGVVALETRVALNPDAVVDVKAARKRYPSVLGDIARALIRAGYPANVLDRAFGAEHLLSDERSVLEAEREAHFKTRVECGEWKLLCESAEYKAGELRSSLEASMMMVDKLTRDLTASQELSRQLVAERDAIRLVLDEARSPLNSLRESLETVSELTLWQKLPPDLRKAK
jgi:hypothetical protein